MYTSIATLLASLLACTAWAFPIEGQIVGQFEPVGRYAGHWGIDIAADPGSPVRAVEKGIVTFAGMVAGNRTVTVHHGSQMRTSYSYLSAVRVRAGDVVSDGDIVGHSGMAHGSAALHFSVRSGRRYLDPLLHLRCVTGRVWLLPPDELEARFLSLTA